MVDPYRNLTAAQRLLTPKERIDAGTYLLVPYDASTNKGLYEDGHRLLFDAMMADISAVDKEVSDNAAVAASAASQSGAWVKETAPVLYLSATTLQITGVDRTGLAKSNRPFFVKLGTSIYYGSISVSSPATYTGGNTVLTVVMKNGQPLDGTLAELDWGQDPDNAPPSGNSAMANILAFERYTALGGY